MDEFQDINRLDFVLVEAIAKKAGLVVTGDDDQAIYGFRGCTPEFIIDLEKHLGRPVESHELQINYRCPPVDRGTCRPPDSAQYVADSQEPRAASDAVAQIHVISSLSAGLEAKSIVKLIQRVRASDPHAWVQQLRRPLPHECPEPPLAGGVHPRTGSPTSCGSRTTSSTTRAWTGCLSILRVKLALSDGVAPSPAIRLRTVCSFFRRVEPNMAARVEAAFRRGGDFMDTIRSEQMYRLLPEKGRDLLPFAMQELLAARSLLHTLDVIAERFRGVYGMIGSLEEVVQDWVPLGEIYEIAAGFHGDTKEFVQTLEAALERAQGIQRGPGSQDGRAAVDLLQVEGVAVAHGHPDDLQRGADPAPEGPGGGGTSAVLRGHDAGLVQSGHLLRQERLRFPSPAQPIPVRGGTVGET